MLERDIHQRLNNVTKLYQCRHTPVRLEQRDHSKMHFVEDGLPPTVDYTMIKFCCEARTHSGVKSFVISISKPRPKKLKPNVRAELFWLETVTPSTFADYANAEGLAV